MTIVVAIAAVTCTIVAAVGGYFLMKPLAASHRRTALKRQRESRFARFANGAGDNFRRAYARVEEAEKLFANAQYQQVLTSLRLSIEGLAKNSGFSAPGEEFFASFFTSSHPDKIEKARKALYCLYRFLHLGPHEQASLVVTNGQPAITRQDARFALNMAHSVFEYITPNA